MNERPWGDRSVGTFEDSEPSERVYVIDDQGRMYFPFLDGVGAVGANTSDCGWGHSPEGGLGIIGIEFIEVHVARRALGPIMVKWGGDAAAMSRIWMKSPQSRSTWF